MIGGVISGGFCFLGTILFPFIVRSSDIGAIFWLVLFVSAIVWWIIDLVDQMVPWWMILTGTAMLGIGLLPRAGILIIACWVIYWAKVRE